MDIFEANVYVLQIYSTTHIWSYVQIRNYFMREQQNVRTLLPCMIWPCGIENVVPKRNLRKLADGIKKAFDSYLQISAEVFLQYFFEI